MTRRDRVKLTANLGRLAVLASCAFLWCAQISSVQAQDLGPFFGLEANETEDDNNPRLLADDFFDNIPEAGLGNIAVEADSLVFDPDTNRVTAVGHVLLNYEGYFATADRAVYNRATSDLVLTGNVVVRDAQGVIYTGAQIEVTGDFKSAFVHALAMQAPNGTLITADQADFKNQMIAMLDNGSYAPCGLCVDEHGHRIGWRISGAKIVLNREEKTLYIERPQIELLGYSLVTLPFYWLPDPTDPRSPGFRFPEIDFSQNYGVRVSLPYFHPIDNETDLWFTPSLMSGQGLLLETDLTHRFGIGRLNVHAAGLYQIDNAPFAGTVGNRSWRGAIQTSGSFTPIEQWNAGWSYLVFSDPAFTTDYAVDDFSYTNNLYLQHLSQNSFVDVRLQEFLRSGDVTATEQMRQGTTIPAARVDHVVELGNGMGQVSFDGDLIGVNRQADHATTVNGVPYIYGYEGTKFHGSAEILWSGQWIAPAGIVATPYLGVRADAANYDGSSALNPVPSSLFVATPIAALDVRFPLMAVDGMNTHIVEPIVQFVYRGSSATNVGINNDNAQGFVFEDSNLFSFNRFSGNDRQETGLRANVGGQYLANFSDGSWVRAMGGQSFQLAGANAFGTIDHAQVGNSTGLNTTASYIVAGATASFGDYLQVGAKAEFDTATASLVRGAIAAELAIDRFTFDTEYYYRAPTPLTGDLTGKHEIDTEIGIPLAEYWTASSGVVWDFASADWKQARVGVEYDDDYLVYEVNYTAQHAVGTSTVGHVFGLNFQLNGAAD